MSNLTIGGQNQAGYQKKERAVNRSKSGQAEENSQVDIRQVKITELNRQQKHKEHKQTLGGASF